MSLINKLNLRRFAKNPSFLSDYGIPKRVVFDEEWLQEEKQWWTTLAKKPTHKNENQHDSKETTMTEISRSAEVLWRRISLARSLRV